MGRGSEIRLARLADDLLALRLDRRRRTENDSRPGARVLRQYHVGQNRLHERGRGGLSQSGRQLRRKPRARLVSRQVMHRLLLPHPQLLRIEVCGGTAEVCRIERVRHGLEVEQAMLVARVSETKEVVAQSLPAIAALAILADAGRAVALGERRAVRTENQ